jgi:hypothetical protein
MNEITFKEGSYHSVTIGIPDSFPLSGYSASIQVRNRPSSDLDFEFTTVSGNTLFITGQNLLLNIPSNISIGKANKYKWQLKVWTNTTDAMEFDIYDFIIEPSINV